jgi:hypothetical protein
VVVADVADTLTTLGIPALVGVIVGAILNHYTAKARGREDHERTLDLLTVQDERRTALAMLDAARDVQRNAHAGTTQSLGELHNSWSDRILAPSRLIRDEEIQARAKSGAHAIFLATLMPEQHVSYVVLRGARDVEEWLEAWLRGDPPPRAHLPRSEALAKLVNVGGRLDMGPLNELLGRRDRGDFDDDPAVGSVDNDGPVGSATSP